MTKKRIKISAVYNDFSKTLNNLRVFDEKNQENFNNNRLSKKQLHFLSESIFFNCFREYENFIRDIFLLYVQEKKTSDGRSVYSYLKPKDFYHAEKLIQSSMSIIDWNTPDTIIGRAELYLKDGFPIKQPYTSNKTQLTNFKRLRNHIAHNSTKSLEDYKKVLRAHHGTVPLIIPSVGEYLLLSSPHNNHNYILLDFFDLLSNLSLDLK